MTYACTHGHGQCELRITYCAQRIKYTWKLALKYANVYYRTVLDIKGNMTMKCQKQILQHWMCLYKDVILNERRIYGSW